MASTRNFTTSPTRASSLTNRACLSFEWLRCHFHLRHVVSEDVAKAVLCYIQMLVVAVCLAGARECLGSDMKARNIERKNANAETDGQVEYGFLRENFPFSIRLMRGFVRRES